MDRPGLRASPSTQPAALTPIVLASWVIPKRATEPADGPLLTSVSRGGANRNRRAKAIHNTNADSATKACTATIVVAPLRAANGSAMSIPEPTIALSTTNAVKRFCPVKRPRKHSSRISAPAEIAAHLSKGVNAAFRMTVVANGPAPT